VDVALYLDSVLLGQHVAEIERERRTAQQLYDQLERAQRLSHPVYQDRYRQLREDVQALADYFGAMAGVVDNISVNAQQVSARIARLLQDNLDNNQLRTVFPEL